MKIKDRNDQIVHPVIANIFGKKKISNLNKKQLMTMVKEKKMPKGHHDTDGDAKLWCVDCQKDGSIIKRLMIMFLFSICLF